MPGKEQMQNTNKMSLDILHDADVAKRLAAQEFNVVAKVDGVLSRSGHYELCMTNQGLCVAVLIHLQEDLELQMIQQIQEHARNTAGIFVDCCGWAWIATVLWERALHGVPKPCADMQLEPHPYTDTYPCFVVVRPEFVYEGEDAAVARYERTTIGHMMSPSNGILCDGVVLTHSKPAPSRHGFKWKPRAKCSIDVQVEICSNSYPVEGKLFVQAKVHDTNMEEQIGRLLRLLDAKENTSEEEGTDEEAPKWNGMRCDEDRAWQETETPCECIRCGCSRVWDADGERVCWCDVCYHTECVFVSVEEMSLFTKLIDAKTCIPLDGIAQIPLQRHHGFASCPRVGVVECDVRDNVDGIDLHFCRSRPDRDAGDSLGRIKQTMQMKALDLSHHACRRVINYDWSRFTNWCLQTPTADVALYTQFAHNESLCYDLGSGTKDELVCGNDYEFLLDYRHMRLVCVDIGFDRPAFVPDPTFGIERIQIRHDLSKEIDTAFFPVSTTAPRVAFCCMAIAQICKTAKDLDTFCLNLARLNVKRLVVVFMDHSEFSMHQEYLADNGSIISLAPGKSDGLVRVNVTTKVKRKTNPFSKRFQAGYRVCTKRSWFEEASFTETDLCKFGTVLQSGKVRDLLPMVPTDETSAPDGAALSPWKWAVIKPAYSPRKDGNAPQTMQKESTQRPPPLDVFRAAIATFLEAVLQGERSGCPSYLEILVFECRDKLLRLLCAASKATLNVVCDLMGPCDLHTRLCWHREDYAGHMVRDDPDVSSSDYCDYSDRYYDCGYRSGYES